MTVTTDISSAGPYDGDGITSAFLVGFPFLDQTYLKVYENDTLLTLGVDYTVTGAGQQTGQVILTSPLAVGHTLTIIRDVPATQLTDYVQGDAFPAESHEKALDKLTMLLQQLNRSQGNALQYPESDPQTGATIPNAVARKNKLLGFGDESEPIAVGIGNGFAVVDGYIHVNIGQGLEFNAGVLQVSGTLRNQVATNVTDITNLKAADAGMNVRVTILEAGSGNPTALGDGLVIDGSAFKVKPYQGIVVNSDGVSANLGEGLAFGGSKIQVDEELLKKIDATVHFQFDQAFVDAVGGYPKGSVIVGSDSVTLYISTVDGNTTDPESGTASGWYKVNKTLSMKRVVITASGTYTPSAGLIYADVEVLGGGGGGGATTAAAGVADVGGGGGAGGYCRKLFTAAEIGASVAVTVGSAGPSNIAGGNSVFLTMTAGGGGGATQGTASTQGYAGTGSGGSATGGDFNIVGASGIVGWWSSLTMGLSGRGADSIYGFGGQVRTVNSGVALTGNNAGGYGAGGAGACASVNSTIVNGGTGSPGIVIVTEYIYA